MPPSLQAILCKFTELYTVVIWRSQSYFEKKNWKEIKYPYLSEFHSNSLYMYHIPCGISFRDKYCIDRLYRQLVQLFFMEYRQWYIFTLITRHANNSILFCFKLTNINKLHLSDLYIFPSHNYENELFLFSPFSFMFFPTIWRVYHNILINYL